MSVYVCVHECRRLNAMKCLWGSEDNFGCLSLLSIVLVQGVHHCVYEVSQRFYYLWLICRESVGSINVGCLVWLCVSSEYLN